MQVKFYIFTVPLWHMIAKIALKIINERQRSRFVDDTVWTQFCYRPQRTRQRMLVCYISNHSAYE